MFLVPAVQFRSSSLSTKAAEFVPSYIKAQQQQQEQQQEQGSKTVSGSQGYVPGGRFGRKRSPIKGRGPKQQGTLKGTVSLCSVIDEQRQHCCLCVCLLCACVSVCVHA